MCFILTTSFDNILNQTSDEEQGFLNILSVSAVITSSLKILGMVCITKKATSHWAREAWGKGGEAVTQVSSLVKSLALSLYQTSTPSPPCGNIFQASPC